MRFYQYYFIITTLCINVVSDVVILKKYTPDTIFSGMLYKTCFPAAKKESANIPRYLSNMLKISIFTESEFSSAKLTPVLVQNGPAALLPIHFMLLLSERTDLELSELFLLFCS